MTSPARQIIDSPEPLECIIHASASIIINAQGSKPSLAFVKEPSEQAAILAAVEKGRGLTAHLPNLPFTRTGSYNNLPVFEYALARIRGFDQTIAVAGRNTRGHILLFAPQECVCNETIIVPLHVDVTAISAYIRHRDK